MFQHPPSSPPFIHLTSHLFNSSLIYLFVFLSTPPCHSFPRNMSYIWWFLLAPRTSLRILLPPSWLKQQSRKLESRLNVIQRRQLRMRLFVSSKPRSPLSRTPEKSLSRRNPWCVPPIRYMWVRLDIDTIQFIKESSPLPDMDKIAEPEVPTDSDSDNDHVLQGRKQTASSSLSDPW